MPAPLKPWERGGRVSAPDLGAPSTSLSTPNGAAAQPSQLEPMPPLAGPSSAPLPPLSSAPAPALGVPRKPWETGSTASSSAVWHRSSSPASFAAQASLQGPTVASSSVAPFGISIMRPPLDSFRGAFGFSSGGYAQPYGSGGIAGGMGYGSPYGGGWGSPYGYGGQMGFPSQNPHQPLGQFYRTIEENIYAFNGFFSSLLTLIGRTAFMYNEGINIFHMLRTFCTTLAFLQLIGAPVRWIYRLLKKIPILRWLFCLFHFSAPTATAESELEKAFAAPL